MGTFVEIPVPGLDVLIHYAAWIGRMAHGDPISAATHGKIMKSKGFSAYIDGDNYPQLRHWYNGEIKPGDLFRWEPRKTALLCQVTKITVGADGRHIWLKDPDKDDTQDWWNDEQRFREAVVKAK